MIPKKLLLFSASLLLLATASAPAQDSAASAQSATPATASQVATMPTVAIAQSGGSYLGISGLEVTRENMGRYNLREPRGVVVTSVAQGSPAERVGLKVNDVILKFDGEQVTTYRKLQRLLGESAAEQNVRLTVSRSGAEQEISVTLGRRRDSLQRLSEIYGAQTSPEARRSLEQLQRSQAVTFGWGRRIGVSTTQLTKQLAEYFGVTGEGGLLVTSVTENSPASRAGLKAGDIIMAVDGEKIESSGDLSRALSRKTEGDVTLTVMRERNQRSLRVTPEKREPGAISISPEVFQIEPLEIEIPIMPTIDIRLPQIKQTIPIMPRIAIPKINIKPEQLRMLEKLQRLESSEIL